MKKTISVIILVIIVGCAETGEAPFEIENAWARPAAKGMNSAVFFTLKNNTLKQVVLIDAESETAIETQIHETYKRSEDVMGMRHIKEIAIPAESELRFKPLGYHVMLIGVKNNITEGDTIPVSLLFKAGNKVSFTALTKDNEID